MPETGQVALVTGGSRGIGGAFVLEAVRRGFKVVFSYRSRQEDAEKIVAEARRLGGEAIPVQADMVQFEAIATVAAAARAAGPVALLVNNAGLGEEFTLQTMDREAWERVVAVNLTAPTFLTKELREDLVANRGSIVNVSSDGGVAGSLHGAPYGATKAGLIGLTKTIARELAPHVRCNAIAPGPVATEMWYAIDPEVQKQVTEREVLLKRVAQPEDIARAGLDLASWPDATGIVVVLDGGRIM
ncbi:MAG TPA: SDR family NAD(P)-dependent oxidoreductase [Candidatus Dormibacteraeota bacterium]|jgi:3-oxoacyl-[acyl-carrier protein] reductase